MGGVVLEKIVSGKVVSGKIVVARIVLAKADLVARTVSARLVVANAKMFSGATQVMDNSKVLSPRGQRKVATKRMQTQLAITVQTKGVISPAAREHTPITAKANTTAH